MKLRKKESKKRITFLVSENVVDRLKAIVGEVERLGFEIDADAEVEKMIIRLIGEVERELAKIKQETKSENSSAYGSAYGYSAGSETETEE